MELVNKAISLPKLHGSPDIGELTVFVQRDDAGKAHDSYYVREGMTITKITSKASRRGIKGLVIVDGGPLGNMLGDSEGPAHENWDTSAERPGKTWKVWKGRVTFVRRIIDSFVELLSPVAAKADFDLLSDFFSIKKTASPQRQKAPSQNGSQAEKQLDTIPKNPKWYRIEDQSGGFRIVATKEIPIPEQARLRVAVAYDLLKGDPLKGWSEFDFVFGKSPEIKIKGKHIEKSDKIAGNVLELNVKDNAFRFTAKGFDHYRDLYVKVEDISGESMGDIE